METSEIKKKLHDYIESAEEEKIKAIYTVLERDMESLYSHWDDPKFVAEMDSRMKELEDGTVKGIPMEEFFAKSRKYLEDLKQKDAV
ncbi:hypothetical protein [Mucilaginibacter arboris]|uniref:Addiction module component n=1 Tax=Mucilaginibacter arboris TaxID=2682090 RepID=A0A7K1SUE4_9SPHI|nr:hypothetical protein [Mucilaginibacter arboris]MVN20680.1 hypothetical protein [Mucilaginibacter arboris]